MNTLHPHLAVPSCLRVGVLKPLPIVFWGQIELVEARFPAEYEVLCAHYLGNCYESEPGPASRLRWGNQAEKKLDRLLSEPALRYAVEREAAIFGAADLLGMVRADLSSYTYTRSSSAQL